MLQKSLLGEINHSAEFWLGGINITGEFDTAVSSMKLNLGFLGEFEAKF